MLLNFQLSSSKLEKLGAQLSQVLLPNFGIAYLKILGKEKKTYINIYKHALLVLPPNNKNTTVGLQLYLLHHLSFYCLCISDGFLVCLNACFNIFIYLIL